MVGACVVALALSGVGAAAASAEEEKEYPVTGVPEIGRCVKVAEGTGYFNFSNCINLDRDKHDGSYDWKPGPSTKGTIKIRITGPKFETPTGQRVVCSGGQLTGEVLNGKELKIFETELVGCTNVIPNKTCYSSVIEKSKIVDTSPQSGELGFIANPKNELAPFTGIDLANETEGGAFLTFNCGEQSGSEAFTLEGSVIGKVRRVGKMTLSTGFSYSEKAGHQIPESFRTFPKDVLTEVVSPILNPLEKKTEAVGLVATGEIEFGELLEIKSKQK
jgi:hypothetical protein